ncbi:hypothetical protein [Leucobacter sp. USHLN153]|uniref:hypothetical protein n=1 Tax=Leucobacter sp. USHLN153 TaxID=3081268 RepID=UPI00301940F2
MNTPIHPVQQPSGDQPSSASRDQANGAPGPAEGAGIPRHHGPNAAGKTATATTAILAVTASIGGLALVAVFASSSFAALSSQRLDVLDTVVGSVASGVTPGDSQMPDNAIVDADGEAVQTIDVTDVTSLDLELEAAALRVKFGDVVDAELVSSGPSAAEWTFATEQGELQVASPNRGFGSGCLFNCGAGEFGGATATLTLPQSLSEEGRLDAEVSVEGGSFAGSGDFRTLDLSVEAGTARITGSAASSSFDVEAGDLTATLADAERVELGLDMGSARLELTGEAPDRVDIEASAGDADVRLPRGKYRVDDSSELGDIDNAVTVDDASKHRVSVSVEAARVSLR